LKLRQLLDERICLFGSVNTANGTSDRKWHKAVHRLNVELVLLTAVALNLEFDHTSEKL